MKVRSIVRTTGLWPGLVAIALLALSTAAAAAEVTPVPVDPAIHERLASALAGSISAGSLWLALLAAWLGGLLTAFTPCVYPLIPITVRYFGGMRQTGRARVIELALIYVFGMVLLYAGLGTLFASFRIVFGSALSSGFVNVAVALLCVLMGLSILGTFSLQLPPALSTRLSQLGGKSAGGALVMGLVSGLIAAPCTGPVLAVILAVIATSGELFYGFLLMTAFGLGLGAPFLLLAISAGGLQRVPTAGPWMEMVKMILATAMFVVAVYYVHNIWGDFAALLADVPYGGLLGWLLIVGGLAAGALFLSLQGRPSERFAEAAAVLLLTVGVSVAAFGGRVTTTDPGVPGIAWAADHAAQAARARNERRPMVVDFTATWCVACQELERDTFIDQKVRAEATRFVAVRLDATELTPDIEELFERYGVLGLPTVAFVDSSGAILPTPRVTGFVPPDRFLALMRQVH
ncbi:MAG: thioredoxin family protein [Deltaproteobacteria bacterium]|nr:thioredoxin family protein [Deltaproteobacteria bacterium]